ncbi:MAG: hypothetical protein D6752_04665 [Candidatus Nitrosothermus koennekii]|nr:MAG: hypothetical protein D6752_04665 [Candidatus Nitrosothermus koennekii]
MFRNKGKKKESQVRIYEENEINLRALKFRTSINYQEIVNAFVRHCFDNPQCIRQIMKQFFDMELSEDEAKDLIRPL